MHYTGTIWRPPYEADSLILEATAGCTHRACKFCTLYDELPFKFKVSELPTMESDLLEAQASTIHYRRSRRAFSACQRPNTVASSWRAQTRLL